MRCKFLRILFDLAETVYGLGANALSEEAVLKIFQVGFPTARKAVVASVLLSTTSMSLRISAFETFLVISEEPLLYRGIAYLATRQRKQYLILCIEVLVGNKCTSAVSDDGIAPRDDCLDWNDIMLVCAQPI